MDFSFGVNWWSAYFSSDPKDCTWTGTWQNTTSTSSYSCAYKAEGSRLIKFIAKERVKEFPYFHCQFRCGHLECSINTFLERGIYTVDISGHDCNDVKMFSTTVSLLLYQWDKKLIILCRAEQRADALNGMKRMTIGPNGPLTVGTKCAELISWW